MKLSKMLLIYSLLLFVPIIPTVLPKAALAQAALAQQEVNFLLNQGEQQAKSGNFNEAILTLNQVIESEPNLAKAYAIRAYSYLGLQYTDSAIINFQKAAELYASQGDFKHAEALRKLVREIQNPSGGSD